MTKIDTKSTASRSIIEEVLEQVSNSDADLAASIRANHIELQDFIVMSMIFDQPQMTLEEIGEPLGISKSSMQGCAERLVETGLMRPVAADSSGGSVDRFEPTASGRSMIRRIFGYRDSSADEAR